MGWVTPRAIDADDRVAGRAAAGVLRRTGRMLRAQRGRTLLTVVVLIGSTLATLAGPLLIRSGIDDGVRARNRGALDRAALGYLAVTLVALVLSRLQIRMVGRIGESFLRDLRTKVFAHLQRLPMSFHDREPTGKLVARMTSDVDALTELVQVGLVSFVTNFLLLVLSVVVLLLLSPLLALASIVAFPLVVLATKRFRRQSDTAYLELRDRVASTMTSLQEGLSGVRVVQASAREDAMIAAFADRNGAQYDANMHTTRISAEYFPVVEFSGTAATAMVLFVGGTLVHRGSVTVGTVAAFVLYLSNLFEPVQQLSQLFNTVQSSLAALRKLFGLLDTADDLADPVHPEALPKSGVIGVHGVSFSYGPDRVKVLDGVDLCVAAGERIALVGPTGAGKSTLAKLMARLYDPTEGTVTYGGADVRSVSKQSLRTHMIVVPQEGYLFTGSLADNVSVARPGASRADVEAALARIGVLDHFTSLPDGLDTEVNERGTRLSSHGDHTRPGLDAFVRMDEERRAAQARARGRDSDAGGGAALRRGRRRRRALRSGGNVA